MGQKVNPHGIRVGVNQNWDTQWYAGKKDFGAKLKEDYVIRDYIINKCPKILGKLNADAKGEITNDNKLVLDLAISKVVIERAAAKLTVTIYTGKPGVVIGEKGANIEVIKAGIQKLTQCEVNVNCLEVKKPNSDAQLVAENIAQQLEKRIQFRRAVKGAIGRAMKDGVKGIKVTVGGRIEGAEIARSESYHEGSIPLQTFRANIDYGFAEAHTTFGKIGVKVWIYKGEVFGKLDITKKEGGNA